MPNLIQIKRSATTATPPTLATGELAWSELTKTLFIGESGSVVPPLLGRAFLPEKPTVLRSAVTQQAQARCLAE